MSVNKAYINAWFCKTLFYILDSYQMNYFTINYLSINKQ